MDLTLDLKRPNTHRIIIAVLLCFAAASLAGIRRWKKPAHAE
jgi:hypothetical protein